MPSVSSVNPACVVQITTQEAIPGHTPVGMAPFVAEVSLDRLDAPLYAGFFAPQALLADVSTPEAKARLCRHLAGGLLRASGDGDESPSDAIVEAWGDPDGAGVKIVVRFPDVPVARWFWQEDASLARLAEEAAADARAVALEHAVAIPPKPVRSSTPRL